MQKTVLHKGLKLSLTDSTVESPQTKRNHNMSLRFRSSKLCHDKSKFHFPIYMIQREKNTTFPQFTQQPHKMLLQYKI